MRVVRRRCNSLESLSDDERGTAEPTRTDAFIGEKSVSHIAAL
jgi:hypothetical protein